MTSCHHHSGYLADDETGHPPYLARLPKKPTYPETGQASKLGHVPHPPPKCSPSSGLHSHHRNSRGPRPFGSFLDFLVKGQVLNSLQTVVETATERMANMKTKAGVPLVEVQDPVEVPKGGRRVHARPSLSTVHRHRVRPSLCTRNPNNYPSCSSSTSDSHSNFKASCLGSHSQDSNLGCHGLGPLPPMRDKLLQEKNLKRLLRLENRGKSLEQSCSQGDSMGSQSNSQWTPEHPLSWFSGLLGSSSGMPETSELGSGERELVFLKQEFNKEIKSLLSQPVSFDLPSYCSLREPHQTLDFLAEHNLFPALQSVVSQAVDKFSGARRHNGCPLFLSEWKPTTEPNSEVTTSSKWAIPMEREEPYDYLLPTTASSLKMVPQRNNKSRGWSKPKEGVFPMSSAQGATKFKLKVTPTEQPKVPSPYPRQEVHDQDPKVQRPLMSTAGPVSSSQRAQPWRSLHITLPAPGIKVEVPSRQTHLTQDTVPLASPCSLSSHYLPLFSPLTSLSPSYVFMKKKPLPSISSKSTMSHLSNPWYEEFINYLMEQSVSLLIYKYKFERKLTKQLGFISFPVTEALMDLFLGFKKVKGSHIHLSSKVNWNCLLRKLEETQWAQPVSRPASQPVPLQASQRNAPQSTASHHAGDHRSASQHNTESPSTLPKPVTVTDQEVAMEPCLHAECSPQLPTPQENSTAEGQEPMTLLEPKLSPPCGTSMGSNQFDQSEQAVAMGKSQSSEEDEGEEEDEQEEDYEFSGDESETQSSPKPQVEAEVSLYANNPGDPW